MDESLNEVSHYDMQTKYTTLLAILSPIVTEIRETTFRFFRLFLEQKDVCRNEEKTKTISIKTKTKNFKQTLQEGETLSY